MLRVISVVLGVVFFAFIIYLFISGNTALALIALMTGLVFSPLLIKAVKGELYLGSASNTGPHDVSGGSSGGVGVSNGCSSGGCSGDGC